MNRYKISKSGIRLFINRNLQKINADGVEHAKQTADGWILDAEAVRIIDELRGFSQISVIAQEESERVKELQEEIENLKNLLLVSQSQLIKVQADLNETQKLLSISEQKLLTTESQSKDFQADLKVAQAMQEMIQKRDNEKIDEIQSRLKTAEQQIERLKKRGLFNRIFNRMN